MNRELAERYVAALRRWWPVIDQATAVEFLMKVPVVPSGDLDAAKERINRIKNRRSTTKWTKKEMGALLALLPIPEEDWAAVEKYYAAGGPYLRRDIQTLLNNWPSEVDRARGEPSNGVVTKAQWSPGAARMRLRDIENEIEDICYPGGCADRVPLTPAQEARVKELRQQKQQVLENTA